MTRALSAVAFVCAIALSMASANAKPRHHHKSHYHHQIATAVTTGCILDNSGRRTCGGPIQRTMTIRESGAIIGGRPSGCPYAILRLRSIPLYLWPDYT